MRKRAVRMVQEHCGEYPPTVGRLRVDRTEDRLRVADPARVGQAPGSRRGLRAGITTAEAQRLEELEREVKELRRANEILKLASAFFAQAELYRRLHRGAADAPAGTARRDARQGGAHDHQ